MIFPRQDYWSGLPCPPPRDLPNPGIEPESPAALALQADSFPLSHQGSPNLHADSQLNNVKKNLQWYWGTNLKVFPTSPNQKNIGWFFFLLAKLEWDKLKGFFNLALMICWASWFFLLEIVLCLSFGDCPVSCRMSSSLLGLYHTSEQDQVSPTGSLSHQEHKAFILTFRGQTEWKPQSQKTNQTDHTDHSHV